MIKQLILAALTVSLIQASTFTFQWTGGCAESSTHLIGATYTDQTYTTQTCADLCCSVDGCARFQIGVDGLAREGDCALFQDGCTIDPKNQWDHYTVDSCPGSCVDTDSGVEDTDGEGCGWYDANPGTCGMYDDNDFTADVLCCACGGGTTADEETTDIPAPEETTDLPSASVCVGWTPLPASDCPSYNDLYNNWADVDCVAEMNLGDWCEGDGTLPDGQATSYLDNCDIYDMFVCSAMSDGSTMPEPTDEPTDAPTEDPDAECEDIDNASTCEARSDCLTRYKKNGDFRKCKAARPPKCNTLTESECGLRSDCVVKNYNAGKGGGFKKCKKNKN